MGSRAVLSPEDDCKAETVLFDTLGKKVGENGGEGIKTLQLIRRCLARETARKENLNKRQRQEKT